MAAARAPALPHGDCSGKVMEALTSEVRLAPVSAHGAPPVMFWLTYRSRVSDGLALSVCTATHERPRTHRRAVAPHCTRRSPHAACAVTPDARAPNTGAKLATLNHQRGLTRISSDCTSSPGYTPQEKSSPLVSPVACGRRQQHTRQARRLCTLLQHPPPPPPPPVPRLAQARQRRVRRASGRRVSTVPSRCRSRDGRGAPHTPGGTAVSASCSTFRTSRAPPAGTGIAPLRSARAAPPFHTTSMSAHAAAAAASTPSQVPGQLACAQPTPVTLPHSLMRSRSSKGVLTSAGGTCCCCCCARRMARHGRAGQLSSDCRGAHGHSATPRMAR